MGSNYNEDVVLMNRFRHHVDYLQTLLTLAEIPVTAIYSQLDPAARKINTAKFATRYGKMITFSISYLLITGK